jgi:hypothetical protein
VSGRLERKRKNEETEGKYKKQWESEREYE